MKKVFKKILIIISIIVFCIIWYLLGFGIEKEEIQTYKIENVEVNKDKIELSSKTNLTYFPLDPNEKLNGVFEITEIHFDGYLTKTDQIITSSRVVGGRFDFDHEVDSSKQIIGLSKNYKGTGYFKCGDLKVEI